LKQWILEDKNLDHPLGPAAALEDKVIKGFRRQANDQRLVQVSTVVPPCMQCKGCFRIFGDGIAHNAPHFHEALAADHRCGSTEE
jgi:hypothetical protein